MRHEIKANKFREKEAKAEICKEQINQIPHFMKFFYLKHVDPNTISLTGNQIQLLY